MTAEALFESENPLVERLGNDLFNDLPRTPGIYKMYGSADRLLYVGKAKDLRSRLQTYRRAKLCNLCLPGHKAINPPE
jgi:hypothetical protein